MKDGLVIGLREYAGIDLYVVTRRARDPGQRAARHENDAAAELLYRVNLFEIGADDIIERSRVIGREMVGAGARIDEGVPARGCILERSRDELEGVRPVEAHSPLRGIHRLGDTETEIEEMVAIGERA